MAQHKWHKEIKAWADGAEIEFRESASGNWVHCDDGRPSWYETREYRIKPQSKEPQYLYLYKVNGEIKFCEAGGIIEVPSGKQSVIKIGKIKLEVED
jgi:hypothetical protein